MKKSAVAFLLLCVLACSRDESRGGGTPDQPAGPALSGVEGTPALHEFSAADLDLYARGIAKEIELVKAARERGAKAATPAERGAAAQAEWEDATIPAAAQAAGISLDDYRRTREAVHTVFETLDFQGKIDGPLEMDLTGANEATKARLAKDPFEALTPAAAAALRAKMDQLLPLWTEYTNLTALHG